jgi:flagellar biosynthetic protein FliR
MHELGADTLSDLLSGGIYALFLILARIGVAMSFLPGFGDTYVNPTARFILSIAISLVLLPGLWHTLPPIPADAAGFLLLLAHEAMWGLFLGGASRIMLMSLDLAGNLIATNTGLSAATSINPQLTTSGPIVTGFLTMSALLVIFVTNTHHLLIGGLIKSYELYVPGQPFIVGDMTQTVVNTVSMAMRLGFQIASPFVVLGLVFNVGLGLLARLVPQMQVFLVGIPIQILIGMTLLGLLMMTLLETWLRAYESFYIGLFH